MAVTTISRKQQKINLRHICQNQAMAVTSECQILPHNLSNALVHLSEFLSDAELRELRSQLNGSDRHNRQMLLWWYDAVEARESVMAVDQAVRDAFKHKRPMPLAERMDAVKAAKALGLVVEQESWTMNIVRVRII